LCRQPHKDTLAPPLEWITTAYQWHMKPLPWSDPGEYHQCVLLFSKRVYHDSCQQQAEQSSSCLTYTNQNERSGQGERYLQCPRPGELQRSCPRMRLIGSSPVGPVDRLPVSSTQSWTGRKGAAGITLRFLSWLYFCSIGSAVNQLFWGRSPRSPQDTACYAVSRLGRKLYARHHLATRFYQKRRCMMFL